MSNFTPTFRKEYEFEDDTITVVFKRMKRRHTADLMPLLKSDGQGGQTVDFDKMMEFTDKTAAILKDCIVSFTGLRDSNGAEITNESEEYQEEVFEGTYFIDLLQRMFADLQKESGMSPDDSKKPKASQPEASTES